MDPGAVQRRWLRVGGRTVAVHVMELGLACCGVEVRAARRRAELESALDAPGPTPMQAGPGPDAPAAAAGPTPSEPLPDAPVPAHHGADLHVLVVAGTITAQLADVVRAAHAALPEPRAVLAFGACAATGGPYWDSYSVVPGAHHLVPVDAWVPGCPPRPADLVAGLQEVLDARA